MDRELFIARARRQLAGVQAPSLPAVLPRTPASGDGDDGVDRFIRELARTNGGARRVSRAALAEAVGDVAREVAGARRVVVADDVDEFRNEVDDGLASAGCDVLRPEASR